MKIIYNNFLPFKSFRAINLFGIVFARKGKPLSDRTINHESIHTKQGRELLWIFFYLWYFIEWVVDMITYFNHFKMAYKVTNKRGLKRFTTSLKNLSRYAYYNISFEKEAYANDSNYDYLNKRKLFTFLKYL